MKRLLLAFVALSAASCGNPLGTKDGVLVGRWRTGLAFVAAKPDVMSVEDSSAWGQTDGAVVLQPGGKLDAFGIWSGELVYRRVHFTGSLNPSTGWLLVVIADSTSGQEFFAKWLKPTSP